VSADESTKALKAIRLKVRKDYPMQQHITMEMERSEMAQIVNPHPTSLLEK
jgi:hypothetical protein